MSEDDQVRSPSNIDPHAEVRRKHTETRAQFAAEVARWERVEQRYSLLRLLSFLLGAVSLTAAFWGDHPEWLWISGAAFAAFGVCVALHWRVLAKRDLAAGRRDVHARHLHRLTRTWEALESAGQDPVDHHHPYAWDIDLVGQGSLAGWLDVTHTTRGHQTLLGWLGGPASAKEIARRQAAVAELAAAVELRRELEVSAVLSAPDGHRLDGTSFRQLAELPSVFEARPWLSPVIFTLPLITLGVYLAQALGHLPSPAWALPVALQFSLVILHQRAIARAFNLGSARQGVVEAFERMLVTLEDSEFEAPLLQEARKRLLVDNIKPSTHMASLRKWVSLGELRQQFLLWILVNPLTLWDLHVLRGLESWNRRVGKRTQDWFAVLGELEALSSLATLAALDPSATFPTIGADGEALRARAITHPLLLPDRRVPNDVALRGPGTALIVTGSNMAGKSTLLRAVGLNIALAQAGGPVCASRMTVPQVRLRASMRAQDSLQEGASYFHAELTKLKGVVEGAENGPPVLFLLDELLRGTNERARHVGAKAVLLHLLERGASGLVATHDVALAALQEDDTRITNVHFTDVVVEGEMRFDYRLRDGVVRTSNALRLLALAGVDVPSEERRAIEG
ncbi:MAG: DNA mismatch repair protein MutS [Myxococcales bacterium]|nr:DNA mismatch repair protein MutS [Myxococcales bacterium]